ncbi:bifunctional biotin--[acetyl-CoA-carboxylase] ligase/biotin operon repressor BirA [Stutzerimonas urumqiensis]|uniref:bifunctional biotin--[acetyl-CoA-carboxylase] ligase/biotin operon repressor BirA n=1 Tax=Stutzerimonas urumqiensis TaxID=638269 RepID=UPI003DA3EBA7
MNPLLSLLQDGKFRSGKNLGESLGVTRASIWKQLIKLEAETGLQLERIRGRGYRLSDPISLLALPLLSEHFAGVGWGSYFFESLASTNDKARDLIQAGCQPPFVVTSEQQISGRGRRGRSWVSPYGENLYFSLVWSLDEGARQLPGLSLSVGLAVLEALRELGISNVGLKWPNDVLVGERKIAGILTEAFGDLADKCTVIIGIGVNVNMMRGSDELTQPWTSVRLELGRLADRNQVAISLANSLSSYLAVHCHYGFGALRHEWESKNLWQGKDATISSSGRHVIGRILGVDDAGALRLLVGSGEQHYSGGELSLRLIK